MNLLYFQFFAILCLKINHSMTILAIQDSSVGAKNFREVSHANCSKEDSPMPPVLFKIINATLPSA